MGRLVAVIDKKDHIVTEVATDMLQASKFVCPEGYGIASPTAVATHNKLEHLQTQGINSAIEVGHVFSKILPKDQRQPLQLEGASLVFEGRIFPAKADVADSEVFLKALQLDRVRSSKNIIKKNDCSFAFVIAETKRLIAGRDVMGVIPLYYGEDSNLAALATERKALWQIGIRNPTLFPPGQVAIVDREGFRFEIAKRIAYDETRENEMMTMKTASETVSRLLHDSISNRISDIKECTIAFSGGLDSCVIASIAKKFPVDVRLVHVSLENQPETELAKQAAETLKLPIHVRIFTKNDVQGTIAKVLGLIENPDPVQTSIGIPIYWTAEATSKMTIGVMLGGQGADELFGGYKRYVDEYVQYGKERVQQTLFYDVRNLHETNFERDYKVCAAHRVELRLPFASYKLIRFASGIPLALKIQRRHSTLRKLALRQLAKNLGLPRAIVEKPKKAIQYATGTAAALRKISRRTGLSLNDYLKKVYERAFTGRTLRG